MSGLHERYRRLSAPQHRRHPRPAPPPRQPRAVPPPPADVESELDAIAAEAGRTARLFAVGLLLALAVTGIYDLVTGGPGLGVMVGL